MMMMMMMMMTMMMQKAQEEVESLLKTAETLALKGDTHGQRDQIINELMRVHTRFQARVAEYSTLLNMAVKFFQDLAKVPRHSILLLLLLLLLLLKSAEWLSS